MISSFKMLLGDYEGVFKRSNPDGGEEFDDRHLAIHQPQPVSFADSNMLISLFSPPAEFGLLYTAPQSVRKISEGVSVKVFQPAHSRLAPIDHQSAGAGPKDSNRITSNR